MVLHSSCTIFTRALSCGCWLRAFTYTLKLFKCLEQKNQEELTISSLDGVSGFSGEHVTSVQSLPNVMDVWTTLGRYCQNVACLNWGRVKF